MDPFVEDIMRPSRIIVAEDDGITRKLLVRQIGNAGYEVIACADGRAAFEAISHAGEGILIADWGMPEMDGVELCQAIRELQSMKAIRSVHIILLTANSDHNDVVRGLEAGADDYLTKPYRAPELLARIRSGERNLRLQRDLFSKQLEIQKANAALVVLNEKLEKLASNDTLTGLYNRRVLFVRFKELWAHSDRGNVPLSCIMLDIDYFKRINDTFGHHAGDVVLTHVAKLLRSCVRPYDVCARFGGEEFVVICPGADLEGATQVAERVRQQVAETSVTVEDNTLRVTTSVGVATREPQHASPDTLISVADAMLYQAKAAGRNQVWLMSAQGQPTCYTPTTVSG